MVFFLNVSYGFIFKEYMKIIAHEHTKRNKENGLIVFNAFDYKESMKKEFKSSHDLMIGKSRHTTASTSD